MKIVQTRNSVFETNSSSTHSISINKINTEETVFIIDNVLHVKSLKKISQILDYSGYVRITTCRTLEEKLALVCLYVKELDCYDLKYDKLIEDEKIFRNQLLDILKTKFNLTDINFEDANLTGVYSHEENGLYGETIEEIMDRLNNLIEVIKDDTLQIIDNYESNE